MLDKIKNSPLLHILLAVVALVGIYPIMHDWIYKSVDLTIEVKSEAVVVSENLPIDNLSLLYKGKNIEALNRVVLELSNSGKTAITIADVLVPLTISFRNSDILEAKISKVLPENLDAGVVQENSKNLKISFSLLNPNDKIYLDILLLGTDSNLDAQARIKNLDEVNIIYPTHQKIETDSYFFSVAISFVIGLLLLSMVVLELFPSIKSINVVNNFRDGKPSYLNAQTKLEAYRYIDTELKRVPDKVKLAIWEIIALETFPLSEDSKIDTITRIAKIPELSKSAMIYNLCGVFSVLFILGLVLVMGFYPIIANFFITLLSVQPS